MDLRAEIIRYSRMAFGISELARTPAIPNPAENLRHNLENRDTNFLNLVSRTIYANPQSPYCKMLFKAQCEYSDLERGIHRDGLEPTLERLQRAGVYLTHDEFKGKAPIIRDGELIETGAHSYDNPLISAKIEARTGGSRSAGTRTPHSVRSQLHWEQYQAVLAHELGIEHDPFVALLPILPSVTGLMVSLRGRQYNWQVEKWYAAAGNLRDSWHCRALTRGMIAMGKLAGANCRFPTYLPENDFTPVAEFVAAKKAAGERCCVGGFVSCAVRVAAVADGTRVGHRRHRILGRRRSAHAGEARHPGSGRRRSLSLLCHRGSRPGRLRVRTDENGQLRTSIRGPGGSDQP